MCRFDDLSVVESVGLAFAVTAVNLCDFSVSPSTDIAVRQI